MAVKDSDSSDESKQNVEEIARELELEVEPEAVTELQHFYDKTLTDEELLLMDGQKKWFLEMESIPAENTMKIFELTTKDLEYYINLVGKMAARFEWIDSNSDKKFYCGQNDVK
ncbi:unnamed protein product [Nyctereutes procyonoides]|uniref:(raccoon dog) hypothetical protein n=1 Tax=Nyctereutes procyonoides TaxID=34880 RepID=A0A811Y970_NYCPR|nr:unnamed protein product [Nyctereutes procyonoides]